MRSGDINIVVNSFPICPSDRIVILSYLFYGDFITVKVLFNVEVLLSTVAYYLFLTIICLLVIDYLVFIFQTKEDPPAAKKVMYVYLL